MAYLFTKCVMKSCDLLDEVIESCSNLHHHFLLNRFYYLTVKKCFNVENIIILSLNTIIQIIVVVDFLR